MKYGDFSALVQLGVGLHLGTALLQMYGEIGLQPFIRVLGRVRSLVQACEREREQLDDELARLEADFEIFRIRLFNEFKKYVLLNSFVGLVLVLVLISIALLPDQALSLEAAVILIATSILPALITLGMLWNDASKQLKPLKLRADKLEQKAIASSGASRS